MSSQARRARRSEKRAREERLRSGGVDPDQLKAFAKSELARITPPGWGSQMVPPPWKGELNGKCRICGGGERWQVVMLTRMLPAERKVLFTFASLCVECVVDPTKTKELGDRVFALQ